MDFSQKKFKEGLQLDDMVTVKLPAYVWHGMVSEMSAQELHGNDISVVMYEIQRAMINPRLINEWEAAQQLQREEAEKLRELARKEYGLGALEDSDPRKEEAD
jgi:hypothetical protein